jgi:hypothetical protein
MSDSTASLASSATPLSIVKKNGFNGVLLCIMDKEEWSKLNNLRDSLVSSDGENEFTNACDDLYSFILEEKKKLEQPSFGAISNRI